MKKVFEIVSIVIMLTGVLMVCQPFFHTLFRYGFLVTLAGIIAFTVASNLPNSTRSVSEGSSRAPDERGPRHG